MQQPVKQMLFLLKSGHFPIDLTDDLKALK